VKCHHLKKRKEQKKEIFGSSKGDEQIIWRIGGHVEYHHHLWGGYDE